MKAGLVVQIAAVALSGGSGCDLTVLINGDEESGSVRSRDAIREAASQAEVALIFEPGEPDGALVLGRPGVRRFRISTRGRAAHSGVDPESGRNAIEGIAHLALAVQDLGRGGDYGTVTVSQIAGGTRPNIVPADASMVVDARVPTDAVGESLVDALRELVSSVPIDGVLGSLELLEDRPAFAPSDESGHFVRSLQQLGEQVSITLGARSAGGSSDGNFTSGAGVPTIDGLGPPGGGFHTAEEWFDVDGLFVRAALVAGLLDELAETKLTA